MQPVLQYGKSGCLNNPLLWHEWHMTSYFVTGAGRAYCGKRLAVKTGQTVVGNMTKDGDSWTVVSAVEGEGDAISTYTVSPSAISNAPTTAYLTLEGMLVYSCNTFPSSGAIRFFDNIVGSGQQKERVNSGWQAKIRHSECQQNVKIDGDGGVTVVWNNASTV